MSRVRKPKLHPAFKEAIEEGAKQHDIYVKSVRVLGRVIADTMADLHGGAWRVQIDHKAGLVAIARDYTAEERS
jgi:hypothetical protein